MFNITIQSDTIVTFENSVIQHGKLNDRIYLMKFGGDSPADLLIKLDNMARENKYSKIFAKVPEVLKDNFQAAGYNLEAIVPNFYNGQEDALFFAKYFSLDRAKMPNPDVINDVIKVALNKSNVNESVNLDSQFFCRKAGQQDAHDMANLYAKVFETYPFPIHDSAYLTQTMNENIEYFGIWHNKQLVALSSSEKDIKGQNVEMTDFATDPEYRGSGFALYLLEKMEQEMRNQNIKTAYTIARAVSYGMNITFAKKGYKFAGTLVNNTNISGSFESMNVWYKFL